MDNKVGLVVGAFFFLAILGAAFLLNGMVVQSDNAEIQKWAAKEGYSVTSVEKPWFYEHPFWFADEDDRIYKVKMRNKQTERTRVAYIRMGDWWNGPEVRWKE